MSMRIIIVIFLFLLSCKENQDPEVELVISQESMEVPSSATLQNFYVKASQPFEVISEVDWILVDGGSRAQGTVKIDVEIKDNVNNSVRIGKVIVKSGPKQISITFHQSGAPKFNLETKAIWAKAQGGEFEVKMEASAPVTYKDLPTWIKVEGQKWFIVENPGIYSREAKVKVIMGYVEEILDVKQDGLPRNVPETQIGVEKDAMSLSKEIKVGWNLGNSLEACSDPLTASETLWGNPATRKELIDLVKKSGFNAIRIPCAWSGYIEDRTTHRIKTEWLLRVREVVDYCIENQMYVILNIHWDGGWLENHPYYVKQEEVNQKQRALWEQIAVAFREYDEHLLFAGTNEVHADYNRPSKEHIEVQMSYNQTFVDAVRATGGKNAWRNLVVQGYNTNIDYTVESLALPKDTKENRLFVEVHYYDPYDFSLDNSATSKYLWGSEFQGKSGVSTWGQEEYLDAKFKMMYERFVGKGIPVVLGEYAATYRSTLPEPALSEHNKSRNSYVKAVTASAKKYGMIPFYWDNGGLGNNSSGIFDRSSYQVVHKEILMSIMQGAE